VTQETAAQDNTNLLKSSIENEKLELKRKEMHGQSTDSVKEHQ
jgi:hypothetical protein